MGVVWLARDESLDRHVAVKVLDDRYPPGEPQDRLVEEARAMARLSHPNVVAVHDVGVRNGRVYVAMELVRGVPLSTWIATAHPWQEVVRVFRDIATGLAAAHEAGLVHRDIKPSNILLGDDGRPRIADFGVAHARHELAPAVTATTTAGPIGTPAYMPPERLIGEASAARGDQFSFCAAFYEALHGRRPFPGRTSAAIATAIADGVPPPLRPVPAWLHAVLVRGMARDPAARFPSMAAVLAALTPPSPGRRRRVVFAIVAAIVAVAVAGVVIMGWSRRDGGDPGSEPVEPVAATAMAPVAATAMAPGPVAATAMAPDANAPGPALAIDAAPRIATPGTAADAGITTVARDAGGTHDADSARRPPGTGDDPLAGLDVAQINERYNALRTQFVAAAGDGDPRRARELARAAAPLARRMGSDEPHSVDLAMSCRLGDEAGARAAFRKLNRRDGRLTDSHREGVKHCAHHGVDLQDLLEQSASPRP